ncbi:MAG TPA: hypothetical protein VJM69_04040 [Dehalococcoidia bacterium]|nr:hypothetical protein [Dehalococcoidia bacterium]
MMSVWNADRPWIGCILYQLGCALPPKVTRQRGYSPYSPPHPRMQ